MNNQPQIEKINTGEIWGLPLQAVHDLSNELQDFWKRFRGCFKSKTRDTSRYAYSYLKGQYCQKTNRNFTEISREAGISHQNLQHFMSHSPWSEKDVYRQIQEEIKQIPSLQTGGALLLDESANEKAGYKSAGAGRQYNGRLGKVDMSFVQSLFGL